MKIKCFEEFDPKIDRKVDRNPKLEISDFKKGGRCKGECNRTIIRTKEGPKIVCLGCKRIIN